MRAKRFTHPIFPITLRKRDRQDMAAATFSQITISLKRFARAKHPILISIVGLRWRWSGSKRGGRVWITARLTRFPISAKNLSERSTRTIIGLLGPKTKVPVNRRLASTGLIRQARRQSHYARKGFGTRWGMRGSNPLNRRIVGATLVVALILCLKSPNL